MDDTQPSKLDELKDYLPTQDDLDRVWTCIVHADAAETTERFLAALDSLLAQTRDVVQICYDARTRARLELE